MIVSQSMNAVHLPPGTCHLSIYKMDLLLCCTRSFFNEDPDVDGLFTTANLSLGNNCWGNSLTSKKTEYTKIHFCFPLSRGLSAERNQYEILMRSG